MEDYLAKRRALIAKDRAARLDSSDRDGFASDASCDEADAYVRRIREAEALSVWGPESTHTHGEGDATHLFPGMAFLTARDIIIKTRLFKIMSKMPKGALLHAHLDATVNARVLLDLALKYPAIHVQTDALLTTSNLDSILPQFCPLPRSEWTEHASLTDQSYESKTWVPLSAARDTFAFGGPEGFDRWVIGALTISPSEAYRTHNTTVKIWDKFASTFRVANGINKYFPLWQEYFRQFLLSSIEDGISYAEVRINFWYRLMCTADGEETVPHREWLEAFDRILHDVRAELAAQGRADEFVGCRIIYSTIRFVPPEELDWYLEDCLALKQEFPDLIVGFDLVGHEDLLRPLLDYLEPLQRFVARQREVGVEIPFIFHAGETLGDGTAADMNLYDALLLNTKRIGHGFSLIKHPELMALCKERGVAVEVCPISNEILRLTSSMPAHPLAAVMNHGVPVTLCSDDPSVFGNMGLSYDFFQVLVASEINGLKTMGCLARDSFKYSCLPEDEKARATALWDKQWRKFIEGLFHEEIADEKLRGTVKN
ncbi:adenosine deaminase-like protein [Phanerochaete sordida]|uniref:adenosine deaminase n=1 Tax=Phanerochaete sordida TaxID=48140 RepID=A0A9P3GK71_9APHY|nr:adenosine deaminase-like protein [Phanerochaete sordida]